MAKFAAQDARKVSTTKDLFMTLPLVGPQSNRIISIHNDLASYVVAIDGFYEINSKPEDRGNIRFGCVHGFRRWCWSRRWRTSDGINSIPARQKHIELRFIVCPLARLVVRGCYRQWGGVSIRRRRGFRCAAVVAL